MSETITETNDHDKLIEIGVLIREMTRKVDNFLSALQTKADKVEFEKLEKKVGDHDDWINGQKVLAFNKKEVSSFRIWIIGFIASLLTSSAAVFIANLIFRK